MRGQAFVFRRIDGGFAGSGHVGWGFELSEGLFCYGGTENVRLIPCIVGKHTSGAIPFCEKDGVNDAWCDIGTHDDMIYSMKQWGYHDYKHFEVEVIVPEKAKEIGEDIPTWGYTAIGNNCLNHVFIVLSTYGVHTLPPIKRNPIPNRWFALLKGEYISLQNRAL